MQTISDLSVRYSPEEIKKESTASEDLAMSVAKFMATLHKQRVPESLILPLTIEFQNRIMELTLGK